jgi:hypothetical protein
VRPLLFVLWGTLSSGPANGAQALVDDPSHAIQSERHLVVWSSGTAGSQLQMQYRPVDGARWKPEPVVDIGWVDDAFRGHEHAFDATGGLKDRLYDSATVACF